MAYTFDPSVQAEQKALNLKGANLKTDGFLGPLTLAARSKYSQGSTFPQTMTSNTITTGQLQPANNLNITGAPVDNTTPSIEGDMAYFQGIQNKISTEEQALQDQKASANTGIESLLRDLGGQVQDQLNLEQQYVNPLQTQIADITGQANVLTAEYKQAQQQYEKMKTDIEAGAGRKGITTGAVMGQQGAVARAQASDLNMKASEIGLLQAQSLALQGKADLAQKQVDRAIDLKYKAKEQELEIKKYQLDQIKDGLTAEQTKRKEAQQYALKKEEERIADSKALEKYKTEMTLTALSAGAPQTLIDAASKATSTLEAAKILGKYSPDTLKYELLKEQLKTEKAQQSKIYTDIAKTKSEMGVGGVGNMKPLSGDAAKIVSIAGTLPGDVQKIKDKIASVGYEKFLRGYLTGTDRESVKLVNSAADKVGRLRSGGAINKDEEKRFTSQFGSRGDYAFGSSDIANSALDAIINEANIVGDSIDPTGNYRKQPTVVETNKFQQATGTTSQTFGGTSILSGINSNGTLNFKLPGIK